MHFSPLLLILLGALSSAQTVYLIRHGEKPADDDETGLSAAGVQRSQCLRNVFKASSPYNIGYILAQTPKASTYIILEQSSTSCCDAFGSFNAHSYVEHS